MAMCCTWKPCYCLKLYLFYSRFFKLSNTLLMFTAGCIAGKLEDIISTTDVYIKGKTCSSGKGGYMSTMHSQF